MNKPSKKQPPVVVPPVYVRLDVELREELDRRAQAERRTVRAVVEAALQAYLATPVRA